MAKLPIVEGYFRTNDVADCGTYACMQCEHIEQDDDGIVVLYKKGKLPKCPIHGETHWMQV